MFELSGVNYEEVLEQGGSILVRVIGGSIYRGFELPGLYCIKYKDIKIVCVPKFHEVITLMALSRVLYYSFPSI